jgi:hypothetical protein
MFVRVASFEGADFDALQELNERGMADGTLNPPAQTNGVLVLADRDAGRHQVLTFFDSLHAIAEAEDRFEAMGDEIPESIRGRRVSLAVYEVVYSMQAAEALADV